MPEPWPDWLARYIEDEKRHQAARGIIATPTVVHMADGWHITWTRRPIADRSPA